MHPQRLLIALGLLSVMLAAQWRGRGVNNPPPDEWLPKNPDSEFSLSRMVYYSEARQYGWCCGWETDYPAADFHLIQGMTRLSRINMHQQPVTMPIMNPRLFQYPYIYSVEPGYLVLSDEEVLRLREYLMRGGTYLADDFHGDFEWSHFAHEMKKVFPNREVVDLPLEHAIFHNVFDIPDKMQVPGEQYVHSGRTWEKGGFTPGYRAILDDDGRPMVLISFNMDWGDAWEHADNPEYEEKYTSRAYRLEINYVVYMMSH